MNPDRLSRRQFLARASAFAGAAAIPPAALRAAPPARRTATDIVTLGKTGVPISRLGFGTGSHGGKIQRDLGQEQFTRLLRYAYDQGIAYIDTADNYKTHTMIREAIKGLPREKLFIQTKMPCRKADVAGKPLETIERYLEELGTDYIDSLLIHCATTTDWHQTFARVMDAFDEAKQKKLIRLKGVSCHGLPGLTCATQVDWVDVHLVRINHKGHRMDGPSDRFNEPADTEAAMKEIRAMRAKGRGMIGMKLVGNGDFTDPEDREKSIRFAMSCGCLDAAVIGFASTAEIDEAIRRTNAALAA